MLAVVHARFAADSASPDWIEDELVRRGARNAHLDGDGMVAVTVEAGSQGEAQTLVDALLAQLGIDRHADERT